MQSKLEARVLRVGRRAMRAWPRGRTGRVASVHQGSVNLLVDDGAVITLLTANAPLRPWAMNVESDLGAWSTHDSVMFGAEPADTTIRRVDPSRMQVVDLRMRRRPRAAPPGCRELLLPIAAWPTGPSAIQQALGPVLHEVDVAAFGQQLAELVGMGDGLTPAVDDFVVGTLASLDWMSAAKPHARRLQRMIVDALCDHNLEQRTTRLSAQLLWSACEGEYAEPILDLLFATTRRPQARVLVEAAGERVRTMGHSSGPWLLAGVNAGLTAAYRSDGSVL